MYVSYQAVQDCNVVKDVHGIRPKGVMVEDILDAVHTHFPKVKIYLTRSHWGGIPSAYVGTDSLAEWVEIRQKLRDMGLSR